tara:strand:+ start:91 stop:771 length:681 start_codon:yes stop_codon:yes gene_type:complete
MKKFLLGLLVFQFFTFVANAQLQKGSIMLGGKINYTNSNSDQERTTDINTTRNAKSNSFSFDPKIGYTLGNNWVIGAIFRIQTGKSIIDATSYNNSNINNEKITDEQKAFGAGLFARKYFPFGDKFSAFGELNTGAIWNKYTSQYETSSTSYDENETKYNEFQTGLLAGIAYFPKNWMAIELSTNLITFTSSDQESEISPSSSNSFDFGFNTSAINLGVSFFLNNK